MAAHLLPEEPAVKKRLQTAKRPCGETFATAAATGEKGGVNPRIGQIEVHIWYHEPDKYNRLK